MKNDHAYRKAEIVGTSRVPAGEAIEAAVARAAESPRRLDRFEVGEIRGHVEDGEVVRYRVSMKVGFRVEG